jgi:hypothetical protein
LVVKDLPGNTSGLLSKLPRNYLSNAFPLSELFLRPPVLQLLLAGGKLRLKGRPLNQ